MVGEVATIAALALSPVVDWASETGRARWPIADSVQVNVRVYYFEGKRWGWRSYARARLDGTFVVAFNKRLRPTAHPEETCADSVHEFGHVWQFLRYGKMWHSDDPHDIMYPKLRFIPTRCQR